jgi:hypothetical protein
MAQRIDTTEDGKGNDELLQLIDAFNGSILQDYLDRIAVNKNHLRDAVGAGEKRKDMVLKLLRTLTEATDLPDEKRNAIQTAISQVEGE